MTPSPVCDTLDADQTIRAILMEIHGKILIADDDPEIRNVLRMLLEEEGYQVISAENG